MAGRPPKPTALKKLQGEKRKSRLNVAEPKPDATMPQCPVWLRAEAKIEWKRVCKSLHECGILTGVDRAALAAYCQAWARWVSAEKQVARQGQILVSGNGGSYINPALNAASMALKELLAFTIQLGMTPSARSRLKVEKPAKEKSLAEVLFDQAQAE